MSILQFLGFTLAVAAGNFISQIAWVRLGKLAVKKLADFVPTDDDDDDSTNP